MIEVPFTYTDLKPTRLGELYAAPAGYRDGVLLYYGIIEMHWDFCVDKFTVDIQLAFGVDGRSCHFASVVGGGVDLGIASCVAKHLYREPRVEWTVSTYWGGEGVWLSDRRWSENSDYFRIETHGQAARLGTTLTRRDSDEHRPGSFHPAKFAGRVFQPGSGWINRRAAREEARANGEVAIGERREAGAQEVDTGCSGRGGD